MARLYSAVDRPIELTEADARALLDEIVADVTSPNRWESSEWSRGSWCLHPNWTVLEDAGLSGAARYLTAVGDGPLHDADVERLAARFR